MPDDELLGDHQGSDREERSAEYVVQPECRDGRASREDWNDPLLRETVSPQQIQQLWGEQLARITPESVARARAESEDSSARTNVLKLRDAGMKIVLGSDTGQSRFFIGWMGQLEFESWVYLGLTPMQAIVAATRDSARGRAHQHRNGRGGQAGGFRRPGRESAGQYRQFAADQQGLPARGGSGSALKAKWQARWKTAAATR